jgi:uncharacterized membrane protein
MLHLPDSCTGMNKNRLEAFSDGVLAIIITIMVLELKAPKGGTLKDIAPLLPVFLSYVQSFLFVGVYWNNHHHLFHTVKKINSRILLANMNLLFWLSLVPFATGWVGESDFAPTAVSIYSGLLFTSAMAWTLLQRIMEKQNEWSPAMQEAMKRQSRKGVLSASMYASAIPLAFVSPLISEILLVMVALMWLIPSRKIEKVHESE